MEINCSLKKNQRLKVCQGRPRPFFSYFGGKSRVADKIIQKFPEHDIFVEAFVGGGGSVYWKNTIPNKFVINDLNKDIIRVYKTAKNSPRNISSCKPKTNKRNFDRAKNKSNKSACDVIKLYKNSFGSDGKSFVKRDHKFNSELLTEEHKEKLKKTKILNQDFKKVVKAYNRKGVVIYLDPPYVKGGETYEKNGVSPEEVCDTVRKIKRAKVFISYDNNQRVRKACKRLKINKISVPYSNLNGGTYSDKNGKTELLIEN